MKFVFIAIKLMSTRKAVTYDSNGNPISCLFCRIHHREEPGNIVYEDCDFVVFKTISPASPLHLLVTPREHISNAAALSGPKDAELVERMVEIGRICVGDAFAKSTNFCFHIPPW